MNIQNSIAVGAIGVGVVGIATKVACDYVSSLGIFEKVKIVASLAILGYGTYLASNYLTTEKPPALKAEIPILTQNAVKTVSQTTPNKKTSANYRSLEELIDTMKYLYLGNGSIKTLNDAFEFELSGDRISNEGYVYKKGWKIRIGALDGRIGYQLPEETLGKDLSRRVDEKRNDNRPCKEHPLKHIEDPDFKP